MRFLAERHCEPELMDQPGLPVEQHLAALAGLRRVNLLSTVVGRYWQHLRRFARSEKSRGPLRVLDVACGGGDVAIRLSRRARRAHLPIIIHGCDMSSVALDVSRKAAQRARLDNMEFFQRNVLLDPIPNGYDVVMCSLFLHHLSNRDGQNVLRAMSQAARKAVLVDDLVRSTLGYALCLVGCRLLTRSAVVRTDGPLSVRAAYSKSELPALVAASGLTGARIDYHWPERFLLSWEAT